MEKVEVEEDKEADRVCLNFSIDKQVLFKEIINDFKSRIDNYPTKCLLHRRDKRVIGKVNYVDVLIICMFKFC